ncbi:hypothetical protein A0U89_14140 (plasmid) [Kozakia baliensis]|uniref:Uncharacterized protein n=1 Tax=Kozakia baliensis TaxID=153496 RepID=A0A1D8UXV7_9PROT|nr:hypothetical protein A0U89_14140 [Kozakia baliensis]
MQPLLANEFIGRPAPECLQSAGKIVGSNEVAEMLSQLVMRLVVEALDVSVVERFGTLDGVR